MTNEINHIKSIIKEKIAVELGLSIDQVEDQVSFQNLGLDSISSMFMINDLEERYHITLKPLHLMEYPTVDAFAQLVQQLIDENH